jgi:hypothetical protein
MKNNEIPIAITKVKPRIIQARHDNFGRGEKKSSGGWLMI